MRRPSPGVTRRHLLVLLALLIAGSLPAACSEPPSSVATLAAPATAAQVTSAPPISEPTTALPAAPTSRPELAPGPDIVAAEPPAQAGAIDAYLRQAADDGRFAGAALAARDGRVIAAKGYGPADVTANRPNGADTIFLIASLTKQFTAAAILQLQEAGRLSVDDPLAAFLPDYPNADGITLHQLLNHTAGVPDYTGLPGFRDTVGRPHTVDELIATFDGQRPPFEPGHGFSYSNSNYILLGKVIEVVSGQTYADYVARHILTPLEMRRSGYGRPPNGVPDVASGYRSGRPGMLVPAIFVDMSVPYAAGALYSTVEDLYAWDRALRGDMLLSPASRTAMFAGDGVDYGYGWNLGLRDGRRVATHGGWIPGFASHVVRWVDDDAVLILLSNIENAPVRPLIEDLTQMMFAD